MSLSLRESSSCQSCLVPVQRINKMPAIHLISIRSCMTGMLLHSRTWVPWRCRVKTNDLQSKLIPSAEEKAAMLPTCHRPPVHPSISGARACNISCGCIRQCLILNAGPCQTRSAGVNPSSTQLVNVELNREDSAADKLPPPEPLDVDIGLQDALTPAGAISAIIEGMVVVQVDFGPCYWHSRPCATPLLTCGHAPWCYMHILMPVLGSRITNISWRLTA